MDPVDRFSARADDYARARPSYPAAVIDILRAEYGLIPGATVADLGSGTGIFTRLLLDAGAVVFAVEPNVDMRAVAERNLGSRERFRSIDGRAEDTKLAPESIELVTAAQAFHWFDLERTRLEALRVLRPTGRAAFVWNDRDLDGTPFLRDYEAILRAHCPGYQALQGKSDTPEKFDAFFGSGGWSRRTAKNEQVLDRRALVARVMSSSYAPSAALQEREKLVRALEAAFNRHARGGAVSITYTAAVIGGRPRPS